jgi:tripartite ATP-independent transporter DctP family solute receptor
MKPFNFILVKLIALNFLFLGLGFPVSLIAAEPIKLRVGYAIARDSHFGDGIDVFSKELDRLMKGRFVVEHLAAGKAGGELELINKVKAGEMELAITSTGPVSAVVPQVRILDLPFLFNNYTHAHKTLDGQVGSRLLETFPQNGLIALAWAEHGFRHLTNNKRPIVYPDDLKDLKIRTMENPVHVAAMKTLNAQPTPMAFTDLIEALRSGSLDGQENPVTVIISSRIYESQKYFSMTQHFYSAGLILMSPKIWNTLTGQEREVVNASAKAAAAATRRRVLMDEFMAIEKMKSAGMQVNIFVDFSSFRRVLRERYLQLYPEVDRKMLESIQASTSN